MTNEQGWTVTFEAAGEPGSVEDDALGRLLEELAEHGASVSGAQDGSGYGATFSVDAGPLARNPVEALGLALGEFKLAAKEAGLPVADVVRVEAMTYAEHDADLARPVIPELVSVSEIGDILGVSRQRAHQLTKRDDFPAPVAELKSGPIWTRPSLDLFIDRWRAGKPDHSAEVEELDAAIAELRDLRNRLVHGNADPNAALWLHWSRVARRPDVDAAVKAELADMFEQLWDKQADQLEVMRNAARDAVPSEMESVER